MSKNCLQSGLYLDLSHGKIHLHNNDSSYTGYYPNKYKRVKWKGLAIYLSNNLPEELYNDQSEHELTHIVWNAVPFFIDIIYIIADLFKYDRMTDITERIKC